MFDFLPVITILDFIHLARVSLDLGVTPDIDSIIQSAIKWSGVTADLQFGRSVIWPLVRPELSV